MLKNLPKMHGRKTRKGSMKVGPDPAQGAGSSADFDFESKEGLGRVRKGRAAIPMLTLSKKTTVLQAQILEDLDQKLRGKKGRV